MFDKNFKISDLDLNIKACTQNSVRSHFNSSLSVVRHEFLELFVRIALDKYYRSGLFANEAEALAMFFKKHKFTEVNPCIWRGIRYFNEECDIILTSNKEILVGIYDKYHGVSANYEKKGMTVEDFIGVIQENQMLTDQFSSRYAAICFHFALISRIDEISNLDHMQAGLLEFIEAFARVCDLSDTVDIEKDIFIGYSNEDPPLEKKIEQILSNFSYLKPRKFRRR